MRISIFHCLHKAALSLMRKLEFVPRLGTPPLPVVLAGASGRGQGGGLNLPTSTTIQQNDHTHGDPKGVGG